MKLPPAVMIHGLNDAQAAVAAGTPVTLLSGPNAAAYAGCAWWREVVAAVARPGVHDILDCGESGARVLEALGIGCRLFVLAPGPAFDDVAERAARHGALVLPAAPPSLDLAQRGARRHLAAWLGSANPAPTS